MTATVETGHGLGSVIPNDDGSYTAKCVCGESWVGPSYLAEPNVEKRKDAAYNAITTHLAPFLRRAFFEARSGIDILLSALIQALRHHDVEDDLDWVTALVHECAIGRFENGLITKDPRL